jgi:hypothetical protein
MATGADAALSKHLTFLVYHIEHLANGVPQENENQESVYGEISLTCDALEGLFRASSSIVGASFKRMGRELLQLLVSILMKEIGKRQTSEEASAVTRHTQQEGRSTPNLYEDEDQKPAADIDGIPLETISPESHLLIRKAVKLLGHFARVGEATGPMAHFPGLLGTLISLISMRPYDIIPWESRLSALWVIANLACNGENMQMMVCTPGLIDVLVDIARRKLHNHDSVEVIMDILRARSIASRAILNLSWSPENKVLLAEHRALIDLLAELTVLRKLGIERLEKSNTVHDILLQTRRHSIGALRNLAGASRRIKISLCEYKEGHLLDVMTDAALNDPDAGVKDRAFATIHNLAIHDTAVFLVRHPALILALKDVLLSSYDEGLEHAEGTPRQHASATLIVLERSITPSMDSYGNLRELLHAIKAVEESVASDDEEVGMSAEV